MGKMDLPACTKQQKLRSACSLLPFFHISEGIHREESKDTDQSENLTGRHEFTLFTHQVMFLFLLYVFKNDVILETFSLQLW